MRKRNPLQNPMEGDVYHFGFDGIKRKLVVTRVIPVVEGPVLLMSIEDHKGDYTPILPQSLDNLLGMSTAGFSLDYIGVDAGLVEQAKLDCKVYEKTFGQRIHNGA